MNYDLELERAISEIKKSKAKAVMIQLPDGLKPKAKEIRQAIFAKLGKDIKVLFWAGSCYGACDTPRELEKLSVGLLIQFGHSEWQ